MPVHDSREWDLQQERDVEAMQPRRSHDDGWVSPLDRILGLEQELDRLRADNARLNAMATDVRMLIQDLDRVYEPGECRAAWHSAQLPCYECNFRAFAERYREEVRT